MTINKAQGQSIYYVGIDLHVPVFSHGQLYVALSRCTSSDRIKVIFPVASNSTSTDIGVNQIQHLDSHLTLTLIASQLTRVLLQKVPLLLGLHKTVIGHMLGL